MKSIKPAVASDTALQVRKPSTGKNKASHPNGTQMIMRWVGPPLEERVMVETPEQVQAIWARFVASSDWFDHSKENVILIAVDPRNRFTGWHLVSTGSVATSLCEPREVLRAALCLDAWGIVVVHNHPSGVLAPSRPDDLATRILADACRVVGVKFLDHVIVDTWGTASFSYRAACGDSFASSGGLDCRLLPPAQKPAVPTSADPVRAASIASVGAGVKVKFQLPRAFLRRHPVESIQQGLFAAVQNETAVGLVRRWNAKGYWSLQKGLRRMRSFKLQKEIELILAEADFERLKTAAGTINEAPESLLAALATDVRVFAAILRKVDGHQTPPSVSPEKILQFPR